MWVHIKINKKLEKYIKSLVLFGLISMMIIYGVSMYIVSAQSPQQNPATTYSFPYASNYPIFSVANGAGPFIPDNWNVFNPTLGDNYHVLSFILEPLAMVEQYTGKLIPWLATNWTFENNYHTLIIYLRHGVYFYYNGTYNGTYQVIEWPFTAKDVVVTYELYFKVYGNPYGVTIKEVNPYEVVLNFRTPAIYYALYNLLTFEIVPWEQYAPLLNSSNPASVPIPVPIGTGPYYMVSQSTNLVILYRNPIYWIVGRPFIPVVRFYGLYNPQVYAMLAEGELQWASSGSNGPTSLYSLFINRNPTYYHAMMGLPNGMGGNNWYLWINWDKMDYYPWNESWFRLAIAIAINYTKISLDMDGELPLNESGSGYPNLAYLPLIMAKSWLNSSVYSMIYNTTLGSGNISLALQILESHGLKLINGILSYPNGTPLPSVTLYGYTDWSDTWAADYDLVQTLKALGIQASLVSVTPTTIVSYLESGNYQIVYWYATTASYTSPYQMYGAVFIPPLIPIYQLSNGRYAANYSILFNSSGVFNSEFRLPNGTLIANATALKQYVLNYTPNLGNVTTLYVANLTAIYYSHLLLTDQGRWVPPQEFINLYVQAGETTNVTQLTHIYSEMAAILAKYLPIIPFVNLEWPFEEWEDQYYIGFSTPQYFYWYNVYVGNAGGPSLPILLNIAPRPPGMTNQQEVAFTRQAWNDLLAFLNGTLSSATPPSLLAMLQASTTVTSMTATSTLTTTSTTTVTSTSSTTVTSMTATTSTSNVTLYVIIAVVVIVIVITAVIIALRRR
ncbi:ABC transporter substrate-binding protein [Saccharolobus islandicus]|uniref:ABC transporter substrate-binding protein n=1 Tax=Saccharolobus islandicus TaxID=43080 RepID=UPI000369E702|nr:ABC transporter substrate-binding protein [Sulfolobus islandicus]